MLIYIASRLLRAAATALGVVTLVFLLIRIVPGDPVDVILGDQASPDERAALRTTLKLDRSFPEQYATFLEDIANGSLGKSFRKRTETVWSLIAHVYPKTLALAFVSLGWAVVIAFTLGTLAAYKQGSHWDSFASFLAIVGLAIPSIWLGPLLILVFCVKLRLLPMPGDESSPMLGLLLPSMTIAAVLMAILTRQTRSALLDVLQEPYVAAARARGGSRIYVLIKHALRNALIPVITIAGAQLGGLLSGTVIAEKIFERQGLGTLFLEAFFSRDIPVIQGCVLVIACTYVGINVFIDVAYVWLDPRIRFT